MPAFSESCPFCPGHETMTPPEVARFGDGAPDTPGWIVRAFPNLYPLVGDGIDGVHEVVVFSPAHNATLGELDPAHLHGTWRMLRDRAAHHLANGIAHVMVFVNQGRRAGASLEHPHAQLVGLPFVPPLVVETSRRFANGQLVTSEIERARTDNRVVRDGAVVSWSPPVPPVPFLIRCAPAEGGDRFDAADDAAIDSLADTISDTVNRHAAVLGPTDYNIVVNTGPAPGPIQWWVDVVPRSTVLAGFELGTGLLVNIYEPGAVAQWLREAR